MNRNRKLKAVVRGSLRMALPVLLGWSTGIARAHQIAVTNISRQAAGATASDVVFDLSWRNAWRAAWTEAADDNVTGQQLSVENWDAAWVFVKYRFENAVGWHHATLSTAVGDHAAPAGAALEVGLCDEAQRGLGVFIYRDSVGAGDVNFDGITLRWLHEADGVVNIDKADIAVHAIEMVYVPAGPFALGSGGSETDRFRAGDSVNDPFLVDAAWSAPADPATDARRLADSAGRLWAEGAIAEGVLDDGYPTGHAAFYCMKYEITQGQYADFLNALRPAQAGFRYGGDGSTPEIENFYGLNRYAITNDNGVYRADRPDRACNYLSWADGLAYAAWAGLRPMTEMEFEKAGRGPLKPVANEYAWGESTIMSNAKTLSGDEDGTETLLDDTSAGGAHYGTVAISGGDGGKGPLRAGIFATAGSTRVSAGASYWGIMELSGNVWERTVSVELARGRDYSGKHGEGALTAAGAAAVDGWPGGADFAGTRGGGSAGIQHADSFLTVSSRATASWRSNRRPEFGWRAVRTAP